MLLFGLRPHDNPAVNQYTITRYDVTVHGAFVGLKPFEQTIKLLQSGHIHPSGIDYAPRPLDRAYARRGIDALRAGDESDC